MISSEDRQMAVQLIAQAMADGVRQSEACKVIGISAKSYQRWQANGFEDRRQSVVKQPGNKLSEQERQEIIETCNQEAYRDLPPKQIVPKLADQGIYLASESTFYRILRAEDMVHHRGRTQAPSGNKPDSHRATSPNQLWSWDITYLAASVKGMFFYLYLFMDIYSRKIVGWEVFETESSEQAAIVLRKAKLAEAISTTHQLVLHSDNGSPMKGATMLATMQKLGVVPSFSRPSVSNDNAFSEALFKTLKYVPGYPTRPFESIDEARKWVARFVHWYNHEHQHSRLKYVTPAQRHDGLDIEILENSKAVYESAKQTHPQRWSGNARNWDYEGVVELNPKRNGSEKKAA